MHWPNRSKRLVPERFMPKRLDPHNESSLRRIVRLVLGKKEVGSLEYSNNRPMVPPAPVPFALGEAFQGFVAL